MPSDWFAIAVALGVLSVIAYVGGKVIGGKWIERGRMGCSVLALIGCGILSMVLLGVGFMAHPPPGQAPQPIWRILLIAALPVIVGVALVVAVAPSGIRIRAVTTATLGAVIGCGVLLLAALAVSLIVLSRPSVP